MIPLVATQDFEILLSCLQSVVGTYNNSSVIHPQRQENNTKLNKNNNNNNDNQNENTGNEK